MEVKKRVCILGAGPSGLAAAKSALECGMMIPTVLERERKWGGVWNGDKNAWDSMRTNLSKFNCAFSDLPYREEAGMFPTQNDVFIYLSDYIKAFSLEDSIRYECNVIHVKKDHNNNKWIVKWIEKGKVGTFEESFDGLIVAMGIYSESYIPAYPNLELFKGYCVHGMDYRNKARFKDKNVVIIGNSYTGAEICSDLVGSAKTVTNIFRKPYWNIPRVLPVSGTKNKIPIDFYLYKRSNRKQIDEKRFKTTGEIRNDNNKLSFLANQQVHAPSDFTQPTFVTISDHYNSYVEEGKIKAIHSSIKHFNSDSITLSNGETVPAENVIFATGYRCDLSIMDDDILEAIKYDKNDRFQPMILYKSTFCPYLKDIAFVGMYRGTFFAILELQARYACAVLSGQANLPSIRAMEQELETEIKVRNQESKPQLSRGDFVGFADSLAQEMGILDFEHIKQNHPDIFEKIWNGPCLPYHYRLFGRYSNQQQALKRTDEVLNYLSSLRKDSKL